jgi:chemotaxis signal transduction protein
MTSTISPPTQLVPAQTLLADRYILTQVERLTLVFPAVWVAEIIRLDRSQILDLPFYAPLLLGVVNHNAQITPLIAAARLLETSAPFNLQERLMVIRLNEAAGKIANVGIVVDRAIGSSTRQELPPDLFASSTINAELVLMRHELIPADLWQPQRWS